MEALADPTRRAVLEQLRKEPQAVGEIAAHLPVSRPAVSQHLKVLKGAGLVTDRAEGTRRLYAVSPDGSERGCAWLDSFWTDVLQAYKEAATPTPPPSKRRKRS